MKSNNQISNDKLMNELNDLKNKYNALVELFEKEKNEHQMALNRVSEKLADDRIQQISKAEQNNFIQSSLLDQIHNAVITIDFSNTILTWNKYAETLYQWTKEEAIGKNIIELLAAQEIQPIVNQNFEKLYAEGHWEGEFNVLRKDKTTIPVHIVNTYLKSIDGSNIGFIGISADITERRQAEEKISYQSALLENVNDAIIATDANFKLNSWNSAAESIYGWKAAEILGRNVFDVVQTRFPKTDKEQMLEIITTSGFFRGEATQCRKDGMRFPVEISSLTLRDGDGNIKGYVSVNRDITERKKAEEAIIRSEYNKSALLEKFKEAQRSAKIGSWEWDLISNDVWWSDELYNIFELNPDTFTPTVESNRKYIHPEDNEPYHKEVTRVIQTRGELDYDLRIISERGHIKHCNCRAKLEYDSSGIPIRFFGTFIDISDRIQAKIEIEQRERLYRSILSASPNAITITDLEGCITFTSEKTYEMFGYRKPYNFCGHFLMEYIDQSHHGAGSQAIANMFKGHKMADQEYIAIKQDGSAINILLNGNLIRDYKGKPDKLIFVTHDITNRKRLEEENQKADSKIQTLSQAIAQSPVTTVITDLSGKIEFVNPKFTQTTGYTPEEAIGQNPRILKAGDKSQSDYKELWDTILSGENWYGEFQNKRKNGDHYWESAIISPVKNNQGVITHFLAVKEEITERKRTENLIKLKTEELIRVNAEKDKFFSIIAHDLRSPFNAFLGFTTMLAEDYHSITKEELQQIAQAMKISASSLFALLENLLEWSRIQRGLTELKPVPISIMAETSKNMQVLSYGAITKGIELEYQISEGLTGFADQNMFGSIIRNLASNALKFTPKGGIVTISAKSVESNIILPKFQTTS